MNLSQYAKKVGVTYRTAFRWWQNGQIQGYQLPAGTIVVTAGEERQESRTGQVVMYARVSSHQLRANLERQAERLEAYCAAKGYQVSRVVKEIDSGVKDNRASSWRCSKTSGSTRLSLSIKIVPHVLAFATWKPC